MHALQYAIAVLRMVALVVILFCVRIALIPQILAIIINAVYSYDGFIDALSLNVHFGSVADVHSHLTDHSAHKRWQSFEHAGL